MYGTQNIDLQVMIEHGLDTEEWIWKYFQPIKEIERDTMINKINQMTLKELKKTELDLSETLAFADQRGEGLSQSAMNELDAIRDRINQLDPIKY